MQSKLKDQFTKIPQKRYYLTHQGKENFGVVLPALKLHLKFNSNTSYQNQSLIIQDNPQNTQLTVLMVTITYD